VTRKVIENGYFELVRRFPLRPIRSEAELEKATEVIDDLIAHPSLRPDESDYLDVLSDLVGKYERVHHPIPDASPAQMLEFFIEDRQTNQRTVAVSSGIAISTMSQILSGQRRMNLDHMERLARHFKVDVTAFLPAQVAAKGIARAARKPAATPRRPAAKR
jgi:HTH-type transcriptional regulator/antitoxin HigA